MIGMYLRLWDKYGKERNGLKTISTNLNIWHWITNIKLKLLSKYVDQQFYIN